MAEPRTYFTIPHDPGPKPAGVRPLSEYLPGRARIRLKNGESVGPGFLAATAFDMEKEAGNQLTDFLYSVDRLLVASERARRFFESQGMDVAELEFLPFQLRDKKGKPRPEKYCVVNPLRKVACLDTEKSDCSLYTNPVGGEQTWMVETIVVDPARLPPEARLFRLFEVPDRILIRSDLLEALQAAELTGLRARKCGEHLTKITWD
jgi:hypothetical protein